MATMRAATFDRYGGPDVLHEAIIERPAAKPDEVLVRVSAASVNGYDVIIRSGALKLFSRRAFPQQTGLDFAGRVAEVPAGAGPFKIGDDVWGEFPLHQLSGMAEYVAVNPRHLSHRPANLTDVEAAALPVVGTTALIALRDVAALAEGERLLVRGAAGGVGGVAVQLGKAMGAHVTGLASAADLVFVRELGADKALDYAATGPGDLDRFDVILDTVGSGMAAWRRRLARDGRMVAIVPDLHRPLRSMAYVGFSRVFGGRRIRFFSAKPDSAVLADLARYAASGAVRPTIDTIYPLTRVADAHRAFEAGGRRGKQVVQLQSQASAP